MDDFHRERNPRGRLPSSHIEKAQSTLFTLPETNIAPENMPSQKIETSLPTIHFQVLC